MAEVRTFEDYLQKTAEEFASETKRSEADRAKMQKSREKEQRQLQMANERAEVASKGFWVVVKKIVTVLVDKDIQPDTKVIDPRLLPPYKDYAQLFSDPIDLMNWWQAILRHDKTEEAIWARQSKGIEEITEKSTVDGWHTKQYVEVQHRNYHHKEITRGHMVLGTDSTLYFNNSTTLSDYKSERGLFMTPDEVMPATMPDLELLRDDERLSLLNVEDLSIALSKFVIKSELVDALT